MATDWKTKGADAGFDFGNTNFADLFYLSPLTEELGGIRVGDREDRADFLAWFGDEVARRIMSKAAGRRRKGLPNYKTYGRAIRPPTQSAHRSEYRVGVEQGARQAAAANLRDCIRVLVPSPFA